jgi:hypothetical protein
MPELAKENYGNHVTVDGAQTVTGRKILDGGAAIKGATSAAAAGYVGEIIEASYSDVSSGSNDAAVNITSLTLPAGVWIIYAQTGQSPSTSSLIVSDVSISLTSATLDAKYLTRLRGSAGSFDVYFSTFILSPRYVVASTTTTVYLVGRNTYTGSAPGVWNNLLTKFYAVREI